MDFDVMGFNDRGTNYFEEGLQCRDHVGTPRAEVVVFNFRPLPASRAFAPR